jgi:hypothetical protein
MVAVVAVENDSLKVQRADGSENLFPLGQSSALCTCMDVGEKRKLKVATGDKLLLQSNWQKKFVNGELVDVTAIQGGALVLADGRVIPDNYRTFTHGYAVTSHAAQGKTVDEVLWSRRRVRSPPSVRNNFMSASRAGGIVVRSSPMMRSCCARTSPDPARGWQRLKWSRVTDSPNPSGNVAITS